MVEKGLTIISAHFKDFSWIELLVQEIRSNTDMSAIAEIIIINQDRSESSRERLLKLDELIRVVEYPISEKHFLLQGHDHATVLNAAVLESKSEYICIFDSDAHPISADWLINCEQKLCYYDAILAKCPSGAGTHPCFMILKKEHTHIPLAFDERLFVDGIDTGRLIGDQLIKAGQKVLFAEPTKCFSGLWGSMYLGSVYHHGSGSFHAGGLLLAAQVTWFHHFFRRIVLVDRRYDLNLLQKIKCYLVAKYVWCKKPNLKPVKLWFVNVKNNMK